MGNKRIMKQGALLLLLLLLPPGIAAEAPPCLAYAFTEDGREGHYSLIGNNTFVFGTEVTVISNCENTQFILNGQVMAFGNYSLGVYAYPGNHEVSILNNGFNATFKNVTFIESGVLTDTVSRLPAQHNPYSQPFTPQEITNMELIAGIGSLLISWVLVVSILWRIINRHQEKNFCLEVV